MREPTGRPSGTRKVELLTRLKHDRQELLETIAGIPQSVMIQPGVVGPWSLKDILVDLTLREAELVTLLFQARQGQKPSTLQVSTVAVDEINARWYEENRERPLDRALADFGAVRQQTIRRVEEFSEADLTRSDRFPWAGSKPLSVWIAADTFVHEAEHLEQIRKWRAATGLLTDPPPVSPRGLGPATGHRFSITVASETDGTSCVGSRVPRLSPKPDGRRYSPRWPWRGDDKSNCLR